MLCPYCEKYADAEEIVCPNCGHLLPLGEGQDTGVQAIRQGRRAREEAAAGVESWVHHEPLTEAVPEYDDIPVASSAAVLYDEQGRPRTTHAVDRPRRAARKESTAEDPMDALRAPRKPRSYQYGRINWALFTVVAAVVSVLLLIGGFLYLTRTANGQRILARMGRSASATALW